MGARQLAGSSRHASKKRPAWTGTNPLGGRLPTGVVRRTTSGYENSADWSTSSISAVAKFGNTSPDRLGTRL